ncbi:unnamed protein product, partial [Pleuronectes platessa]
MAVKRRRLTCSWSVNGCGEVLGAVHTPSTCAWQLPRWRSPSEVSGGGGKKSRQTVHSCSLNYLLVLEG